MLPARHRLRTSADFSATVRGAGRARSGGRLLVVHGRYAASSDVGGESGTEPSGGPGSELDDESQRARPGQRPSDRPADRPARVGFVVSTAVGGAVTRNRTKRVLRHLVAARLTRIPAGCDLVVRANPAAADASTSELAVELDRAVDAVLGRLRSEVPA